MYGHLTVGSNDAVLKYAHKILKNNGAKLSTYVLGFYVRLVNIVFYQGYPATDCEKGVFCLCCTPKGLSEHMKDFPARRITLMLSQLAENGLITYEPNADVPEDLIYGEKPYKNSKPFRITIYMKEFLFMDLHAICRYFYNEERYVLNQGAWRENRQEYCDKISFSADSVDDDMTAFMRELCEKIQKLSDDEWDHIQQYFPLPTSIDEEEIDESEWESESEEV